MRAHGERGNDMTVDDIQSCDIRYRNKEKYRLAHAFTGPYQDPDDRLWTTPGGAFVLTYRSIGVELQYAVDAPLALECVEKIVGSAGTADGSGEYEAVVKLNGQTVEGADPGLLKELFGKLVRNCGGPLSERELYRYVFPIPPLPKKPYQVWLIQQDTLVRQPHPSLPVASNDTECSHFCSDDRSLELYRERKYYRYRLPPQLLEEVNERCWALLENRVDGYRTYGEKGAMISLRSVDGNATYYVDPDVAYGLLADLAKKCGAPLEVRNADPRPAFGMFGIPTSPPPQPSAPEAAKGTAWKCACGAESTGNFCPQCGARRKT